MFIHLLQAFQLASSLNISLYPDLLYNGTLDMDLLTIAWCVRSGICYDVYARIIPDRHAGCAFSCEVRLKMSRHA